MIERLVILASIMGLALLAWLLLSRRALARTRRQPLPAQVSQALQTACTAILYFSTPSCVQCRTLQAPALLELQRELGPRVEVVPIDAAANPDLTAQLGILTVPSTVVFDRLGVRAVNLGFASTAQLRQQTAQA